MTKKIIETRDLCKYFGDTKAVDRVSLRVNKGDVYGYLGPNGAGKTTTIRVLTGLLKASSGTAFIKGIDVSRDPFSSQMNMGVVLDKDGFYPNMSGLENLVFYSDLYGTQDRKKLKEVLETVGLCDAMDQKVGEYSRGMRQRLSLARAIAHDPELLLLDEPTAGLDPAGTKAIRDLIIKFAKQGKTIFISSHLLHEVSLLCNKIGMLNRGCLIAEASTSELKKKIGKGLTLAIELDKVPKKLISSLKKTKAEVRVKGRRIWLTAKSIDRSKISKKIVKSGATILEMKEEGPSLEDVYMKLVGGK